MKKQSIEIIDNFIGMPASLRWREKDVHFSFWFPKAVRVICRKRIRIPVSDWAERHRYVTSGRMVGTRFKKITVPYAPAVMDASFYPGVEEIVMCMADQASKSFIVDTCIGYAIDRDPGTTLIVYPDEDTTRENIKDRVTPMITLSPRLRSYMTGAVDDEGSKRINLAHMQIYAAWASSAIRLANRAVKYLVLDETDKYPLTAGRREADPISKAEKRVRTYRYNRKIWKCSTPTIEKGPIWIELNSCQVVFEYHVYCPDCGAMHLMTFDQIKWPENERDPVKVKNEDLAYYICPHCGSCWTDLRRDAAVQFGRWMAMERTPDNERDFEGGGLELFEYLKKYNPKKIGFHAPSWLSPFVGLSEAAAAFLKGLQNKNLLKDFRNSHQAIPWTDYTQEREEDRILALRDDRPRGLVPGGDIVACLTAGVDTQDNGFWYEIRAWSWGDTLESWQIREGFIDSFNTLLAILEDEYEDTDGREYRIAIVIQDAMGHRTNEVYDFCRMRRNFIIPSQGVDTRRMTRPHDWSAQEFYAGTKKRIPGGIILLRFDATFYKNALDSKLEINPEDPGAWHLHGETTEEWARHMCAEYINDKSLWECMPGRANHGWDCSVLNMLAVYVLRENFPLSFWRKKKAVKAANNIKDQERERPGFEWRPGWLRDRK